MRDGTPNSRRQPSASAATPERIVSCDGWLGLVPKLISTGDRTLGSISRRGNRYLRALFVQTAWVVLVKPKHWERYGLKSWIEAAKKRLYHNVLAVALANKLARIAWAVLNKGCAFACVKTDAMASRPA
jgi:transposase